MLRTALGLLSLLTVGIAAASSVPDCFPVEPGPVTFNQTPDRITLENRVLKMEIRTEEESYAVDRLTNKYMKTYMSPGLPINVEYKLGDLIDFTRFKRVRPVEVSRIGRTVFVITKIEDEATGLAAWVTYSLKDNEHYFKGEVKLVAEAKDIWPYKLTIQNPLQLPEDARAYGEVNGSPAASEEAGFWWGVENPMSITIIDPESGRNTVHVNKKLGLKVGQSLTEKFIFGVMAPGQLRRSFLSAIESERPRPYAPFLHYNSWYDIGYFDPYTETQAVERINAFGQELAVKRGVKLSSFLFDDGWDNYESDWRFSKDFPHEFLPLKEAAAKYGAAPGIWLSPWGGYGGPREKRLAWGKAHGEEVDSQGFALSGPNYYKRFHELTMDLVTRQSINQFKFDGTGSPDKQFPGSQFASDFEAAISLIGDLRKAKPDLFVNLTTGTWPSPFWLMTADSTWRGGGDHGFAGVGSKRNQWITYRDGDTYLRVVKRGELYPINSLMLHGLIFAQHAGGLESDPDGDFVNEVRSYFGSGTQLQEMYITPSLLSTKDWDELARAAKWSEANKDVFVDTHWVGGDPNKLDIYGWGAWNKRKGFLTLRNPSDQSQAFSIDPRRVLEVPKWGPEAFNVKEYWSGSGFKNGWKTDNSEVVILQPFEVRTYEFSPIGGSK